MRLNIEGISKSFGPKRVLENISFSADAGVAVGLLGRNGAGKTTTIRIIMHVFPPDEGRIMLDDKPLRPNVDSIGYLPEEKGLYPKYKIKTQLVYLGQLRGLSRSDAEKAVDHWLERLSLSEYQDKKLETLSKGNQQKIQLALSLLADPKIVILDEPFSGLDPVNAQLLKTIVREQVDAGKIVLFSSHQMSYVEQFCDQVALLDHGKIVLQGDLKEIKREHARNRLLVALANHDPQQTRDAMTRLLSRVSSLAAKVTTETTSDGCLLHLANAQDRNDVLRLISQESLDVEQFRIAEPSLEDIFVERVEAIHEST